MQLKELLRISRFENYSIKIEGEKEVHFVNKDKAFESFGLMYVTEIDYTILFLNKGEDYNSHESVLALSLLVIDKDKVKIVGFTYGNSYQDIEDDLESLKIIF